MRMDYLTTCIQPLAWNNDDEASTAFEKLAAGNRYKFQ
jgi:hypothetical protein